MRGNPEKVRGIVLSAFDYGESDRIVSLFTIEHGRVKAFARGARKSRRRFGHALEVFSRIEAELRLKVGLCNLQEAMADKTFIGIRSDLAKICNAMYACEAAECMTPEGHPLPRFYRLLSSYLDHLDSEAATESDRRFFEVNMLNILGYRPRLDGCACCGAKFGASGAVVSARGELVCKGCGEGRSIDAGAISLLSESLAKGRFGVVRFAGEELMQAGVLLDSAIAEHAGKRLKSLEFIRQNRF